MISNNIIVLCKLEFFFYLTIIETTLHVNSLLVVYDSGEQKRYFENEKILENKLVFRNFSQ